MLSHTVNPLNKYFSLFRYFFSVYIDSSYLTLSNLLKIVCTPFLPQFGARRRSFRSIPGDDTGFAAKSTRGINSKVVHRT